MKGPSRERQFALRFAHRPELRDLGWWFCRRRSLVALRLNRAVKRVERARRKTHTGDS